MGGRLLTVALVGVGPTHHATEYSVTVATVGIVLVVDQPFVSFLYPHSTPTPGPYPLTVLLYPPDMGQQVVFRIPAPLPVSLGCVQLVEERYLL